MKIAASHLIISNDLSQKRKIEATRIFHRTLTLDDKKEQENACHFLFRTRNTDASFIPPLIRILRSTKYDDQVGIWAAGAIIDAWENNNLASFDNEYEQFEDDIQDAKRRLYTCQQSRDHRLILWSSVALGIYKEYAKMSSIKFRFLYGYNNEDMQLLILKEISRFNFLHEEFIDWLGKIAVSEPGTQKSDIAVKCLAQSLLPDSKKWIEGFIKGNNVDLLIAALTALDFHCGDMDNKVYDIMLSFIDHRDRRRRSIVPLYLLHNRRRRNLHSDTYVRRYVFEEDEEVRRNWYTLIIDCGSRVVPHVIGAADYSRPEELLRLQVLLLGIAETCLSELVVLFTHPNLFIRQSISWVFNSLGQKAVVSLPHLLHLLRHEDDSIVESVVAAISLFGPKAAPACDELISLLTHPNVNIRYWSEQALNGIGEIAVYQLKKRREQSKNADERDAFELAITRFLSRDSRIQTFATFKLVGVKDISYLQLFAAIAEVMRHGPTSEREMSERAKYVLEMNGWQVSHSARQCGKVLKHLEEMLSRNDGVKVKLTTRRNGRKGKLTPRGILFADQVNTFLSFKHKTELK